MQLTIQEKVDNALLDRTMVRGEITFEQATPSNNDLAIAIGKQMGSDPTRVVVKHIYSTFGHRQAAFEAEVYKTVEARQKTVRMTSHLRKKLEEGKKGEA